MELKIKPKRNVTTKSRTKCNTLNNKHLARKQSEGHVGGNYMDSCLYTILHLACLYLVVFTKAIATTCQQKACHQYNVHLSMENGKWKTNAN